MDGHDNAAAGHTDSDDMDYEPAIEEEGDDESDEEFLERFLDEVEDAEDEGGNQSELASSFHLEFPAKPLT
jgi:hypothetical protein